MDIIARYTVEFVLLAVLAGFLALLSLVVVAVLWVGFHMLRDHWSLMQTWHQARVRLFH